MKQKLALVFVLCILCIATRVLAAEPAGTLVFQLRDYESDVKLKKKVQKQLEHAGLQWGFEGHELVIPFVSPKFVKPELSETTRWGETDEVQLAPGEYRITCIGYEQRKLFGGIEKVLSESAYFNESVLTFTIRPGEVTKLEILPRFHKTGTMIKVFVPALHVKVIENGAVVRESVVSERTASSIPWDEYSGPLKF